MARTAELQIEVSQNFPVPAGSDINLTDWVHTMSWQESLLTGDLMLNLSFLSTSLNRDEDLVFANTLKAIRVSQVRNGIAQSTGWRPIFTRKAQLYYDGSSPAISIVAYGLSSLMQDLARWRAFVNVPAVNIFTTIAQEYGFTLNATQDIPGEYTWYCLGETDWDFLRSVVGTMDATARKQAVFVMLFGRTLQIKPIDYGQPVVRKFGVGYDDRAEEIEYKYHGIDVDAQGGDRLITSRFDIATKTAFTEEPETTALPVLAGKLPRSYGTSSRYRLSTRGDTTARWGQIADKYFSCLARMVGDVSLSPGQIVSVHAKDPDETESSYNGKYAVYEVLHEYRARYTDDGVDYRPPHQLMTYLGGFRRTFQYGDIDAEGTKQTQVISVDGYQTSDGLQPDDEPIEIQVQEL